MKWRRHCSIGQSSCSMMLKRSIDWFLESYRAWSFFIRAFACSINQSNRSISVRLFFLFCLRVFISRRYENHFNSWLSLNNKLTTSSLNQLLFNRLVKDIQWKKRQTAGRFLADTYEYCYAFWQFKNPGILIFFEGLAPDLLDRFSIGKYEKKRESFGLLVAKFESGAMRFSGGK